LSVKVNNGFGPDTDDEDLGEVVEAAADAGVDVAYLSGGSPDTAGPDFPLADPDARDRAVGDLERAIDVASDVGAMSMNVIPGHRHERLDPAVQHMSVVNALRQVAGRAERAGVTVLVEPINAAVDHPGIYMAEQAECLGVVRKSEISVMTRIFDSRTT